MRVNLGGTTNEDRLIPIDEAACWFDRGMVMARRVAAVMPILSEPHYLRADPVFPLQCARLQRSSPTRR